MGLCQLLLKLQFLQAAGSCIADLRSEAEEKTVIEGVANPNSNDPRTKPNYRSQTVFVANSGVSLLHGGDGGRGFGSF